MIEFKDSPSLLLRLVQLLRGPFGLRQIHREQRGGQRQQNHRANGQEGRHGAAQGGKGIDVTVTHLGWVKNGRKHLENMGSSMIYDGKIVDNIS